MKVKELKPWQAVLISIFIILMGIFIIYITWNNKILNLNNFYYYICEDGAAFIFGLFFIGTGLFMLCGCITEYMLKPKKVILYVLSIEKVFDKDQVSFIDRNGKIYKHLVKDSNTCTEKYFYEVIKTRFYIKEIIGLSYEEFEIIKEKKSYWKNLYTPLRNIEDLYVLPVLYVLFLPGFLSFLMSEGTDRIYGFVWSVFPGSFIIYDLVYKLKHK